MKRLAFEFEGNRGLLPKCPLRQVVELIGTPTGGNPPGIRSLLCCHGPSPPPVGRLELVVPSTGRLTHADSLTSVQLPVLQLGSVPRIPDEVVSNNLETGGSQTAGLLH